MNNQLNYNKWFQNAIFKKKFEALEFLINQNKNLAISLENKKINEHIQNKSTSITLKGLYQQKKSSIYLEKIDDNMLEEILNTLKNQIEISFSEYKDDIFSGSFEYPSIKKNNFDFSKIKIEKKYNLLFKLEKKISKSPFYKQNENITYSETFYNKKIINSKGLNLEQKENFAEIYVFCLFEKNNKIEEISEYFLVKEFQHFDIEKYAQKIIKKGEKKLDAQFLKSGIYDIIFSNKTFAKLLQKFSGIFNGMNVYHNLTKLKDKINQKIASSKVTIIDNPLSSSSFFQYKFDDEGIAGKKKIIVQKGILKQFIHNLRTANIFNVKSTGNCFNNNISMSNCYLEKGQETLNEIIIKIKKGIFIDELIGLHAGINDITGDFSIQAKGFKIEKGKITYPVKMIIISGNFFNILQNLKNIANDFIFNSAGYGSASVYVGTLSVAGKE
ncbi:modulator of DNA gyrase family protein [Candidatus Phytoplasma oryzae]|uniref:Modulator of DNA gyrase family protein n=1 Tax=Candidatus Phytoplasma oryzae TaxID=203274 RepID=A0A139JR44_9MOLU|nr:metallopeptidase TldD-related protein [Candidatus Phytoplasma oryzae]KXT29435.1 modulator of DNA gyrase family protein [Candidatus Phytoplasma oryzae]RAM58016.1 PmbA [Candidatus Phytoplasma oryzae]